MEHVMISAVSTHNQTQYTITDPNLYSVVEHQRVTTKTILLNINHMHLLDTRTFMIIQIVKLITKCLIYSGLQVKP